MADIRASFFAECDELLEALHDALTLMEDGDGDGATVDSLFRAVHSIKGGAGAFGLDALTGFAHHFEAALDHLRCGELAMSADVLTLFFEAADLLQDHVHAAREGATLDKPAAHVLAALEGLAGGSQPEGETAAFTPIALALVLDESPADRVEPVPERGRDDETGPRCWSIRLQPTAALYASGNETLLVLRALCALGEASVACEVPPDLSIADADAENPRLAWQITLEGEIDRAEIDEVFDFIADVCAIHVTERPAGFRSKAGPSAMRPREDADQAPGGGGRLLEAVSAAGDDAGPQSPPDREAADGPPVWASPLQNEPATTIRVDLQKIDDLVNLVGELVINQAMLSQSVALAGIDCADVTAGLDAFLSLTRDIQDKVMSARAQLVKPLFQRMSRVVREASVLLGKEVRLKTEGGATEVDRTVIERLAEPLTHMIRNSVDHGIETPEQRLAAGKPREGQITLSAAHRAGRFVVEVADDGAGIDRQRVLDRARSRGLIPRDATPGDAEIDGLLFLPGFSTAGEVSAVSGRGVGMDVVKRAIEALGGRVSIDSERGIGTRFALSLPLTLAVLDGMVVQVAGQTLVIPLAAIIETASLASLAIRRIGDRVELLQMRGGLVPVLDLGVELGFRPPGAMNRDGIVLLTVTANGDRAALIVDAVKEQRQVVIKGLDPALGRIPGVAAATILGDGRIALIIDPADLSRRRHGPDAHLRKTG